MEITRDYFSKTSLPEYLSEEDFAAGVAQASRLIVRYERWLVDPKFKELFSRVARCHYPNYISSSESVQYRACIIDIFRLHARCGLQIERLDRNSIAAFLLIEHSISKEKMTISQYRTFLGIKDWAERKSKDLREYQNKAVSTYPNIYFFAETLREIDHLAMNEYIDSLAGYLSFLAERAGLDAELEKQVRVELACLKSDHESSGNFPLKWRDSIKPKPVSPQVSGTKEMEKEKRKISGFTIGLIVVDVITTIFIIWFFCDCLLPGFGFIAGGLWFVFWLLCFLALEFDWNLGTPSGWSSSYSSSSTSSSTQSSGSRYGWLDDFDMTKDYYGKHGEFDRNDESRRVSEDIQQFHNCHPDADLHDHYYWDDILDAETDGYLDD